MMKKKLQILSLLAVSLPCFVTAQEEQSLVTIEKKFEIVDVAVELIERYPKLKVNNSVLDKLPFRYRDKTFLDIVNEKATASYPLCSQKGTIDLFVIAYLGNLEKEFNNTTKERVKDFFHHTKKLFNQTNFNGGRDFDETLLAVYHIHRTNFKILVELERIKTILPAKATLPRNDTLYLQITGSDSLKQNLEVTVKNEWRIKWDVNTVSTTDQTLAVNLLLNKIKELDDKQTYTMQCVDKLKDEWTTAQIKTNEQLEYLAKSMTNLKSVQNNNTQLSEFFKDGKWKYRFDPADTSEINKIVSDTVKSYSAKRRDIKRAIRKK